MIYHKDRCLGCVVSKLDGNTKNVKDENGYPQPVTRSRGYIAMLSVEPEYRRLGLGRLMVKKSIDTMVENGADEIILETEGINEAALRLYESFGFMRDKRHMAYYLNGNDAFKLKLLIN